MFQSLDSVVQLKMRIDKGDASAEDGGTSEQTERAKWQTLTLQQLNDLQSKLMLVAGKASEGKEQVDRFVEVTGTSSVVVYSWHILGGGYLTGSVCLSSLSWLTH